MSDASNAADAQLGLSVLISAAAKAAKKAPGPGVQHDIRKNPPPVGRPNRGGQSAAVRRAFDKGRLPEGAIKYGNAVLVPNPDRKHK